MSQDINDIISAVGADIAHSLGCVKKTAKNQWNCIVLNFN